MKRLVTIAVLAGIAMARLAPSAHADFQLRYSTDGGATFSAPVTSGGPGTLVAFPGLTSITATSSTNASVAASLDLLVGGSVPVGLTQLVIQATLTGVLTSPPPETLTYHFTGSILPTGGTLSGVTFTGETWIDQSNQDFGGALLGPGGTNIIADTNPQAIPAGPTSFSFSGVSPYSITTQLVLTFNVTGGTGASISADLNNTVTVPAPAGIVLLLSSAPVFALIWRRRLTNN
jgi:hypothetical protein